MPHKPVIWSIAGSDSGGGAGIQADLLTINSLGGHCATIISAITAQNSHTVKMTDPVLMQTFISQLEALAQDLPPRAIKIGLLPTALHVEMLAKRLSELKKHSPEPLFIIYDPVLRASSGDAMAHQTVLKAVKQHLLPILDLITPNYDEFNQLTAENVSDDQALQRGIDSLLGSGCRAILLKGGHDSDDSCCDRLFDGNRQLQLRSKRIETQHGHGTGCCLASAIASAIALDYPLEDALVIAKAYLNQGLESAQGIGKGPGPIAHLGWPDKRCHFPEVFEAGDAARFAPLFSGDGFTKTDTQHLGLYPVVDSSHWIEKLLKLGITTLQLRIKQGDSKQIEREIQRAVQLGRDYRARVFINDYWQLAIQYQAYGVHLGQEDLQSADLQAIQTAGLRLGLSTHGYFELLRAAALRPSYIALGHIFPTTTKQMPSKPQGLKRLSQYAALMANFPLVAIGGIDMQRAAAIAQTGIGSIAVVRAITEADDPDFAVARLQEICDG